MRSPGWPEVLRRVIAPAIAVAGVPVLVLIAGLAPAAGMPAHGGPGAAVSGPGDLSRVSCSGRSFCMAAGSHSVPGNARARLVEEWNGRTWRDAPDPLSGVLTGLACGSPRFCFARRPRTLAVWNGTTWRSFTGSGPAGITCGSPGVCMAVAGTKIDQWNGTRWHLNQSTDACAGTPPDTPCGYAGLSCGGRASCLAISYFCPSTECAPALQYQSQAWNGTTWNGVAGPPTSGGRLACSRGSFCMLTYGAAQASTWQPAGWQDASPDLPAVCNGAKNCDLTGQLSCGAPHSCVVVPAGSLLSLVWSGSSWRAVPLALVGGKLPRLSALSCGSAVSCMAVGSSGKPPVPVAEHWNGTKWQLARPRTS
jgi:hypothetical protein